MTDIVMPGLGTSEPRRVAAARSIEAELSELVSRIRVHMRRSAEAAAPGLTPASYKALSLIDRRGPITLSALTEIFGVDKSLISRAVRELEDHEFISRTRDPNDGRSQLLSATPHARARLEVARKRDEGRLLGVLADWDLLDIERLADLLHALNVGDATAKTKVD